ncbi:glutamate receptor 3-like [Styela clava]
MSRSLYFCILYFFLKLTYLGTYSTMDNFPLLVGIISSPVDNNTQLALSFVRDFVNENIMPDKWSLEYKFFPSVENQQRLRDVTGAGLYLIADSLEKANVSSFIGPGSSTNTKLIHAFAVSRNLPHLSPFSTDPALGQSSRFPMLIRLSPPDTFQTKAVFDILQFYGWERLSLITMDNDYGFGVKSEIVNIARTRGCKIEHVTNLKITKNIDEVPTTEILDQIQALRPHPVVLVAGGGYGKAVLKEAHLRDMTVEKNWLWILMDGVAVDEVLLVEYEDENSKITISYFDGLVGTRPVMSEGVLIHSLVKFWEEHHTEPFPWKHGLGYDLEKPLDAILSVAHGFRLYYQKGMLDSPDQINGTMLFDAILRVKEEGLTTKIAYDSYGKTKSTEYDIFMSDKGTWKPIGEWSESGKLNMSYALSMNYSRGLRSARASFFDLNSRRAGRIVHAASAVGEDRPIVHVVTIIESPFVIEGKGGDAQEKQANRVSPGDLPPDQRKPGMNVSLHGYCIDMLQKLSENAGIRYTLRLVSDSNYGGLDQETGRWSGMIGDVKNGRVHIAVAPITVTQQRSEVVDFSTAFMHVGLKFIVDRRAADGLVPKTEKGAFAFLLPFHGSLYLAIGICMVCLACFLCLVAHVSPYGARGHFFLGPRIDEFLRKSSTTIQTGYSNPGYHIGKDSVKLKRLKSSREDADRAMGFNNALYFVWASLFWQTPERVPRAPSARFVTVIWYLSAVVFVAAYTANMVAFVSSKTRVVNNLKSVSELVSQTEIPFGTVSDSSVKYILKSSEMKLGKSVYNYIMTDPDKFLVPTSTVGLERVKKGIFALLWDSLVLDFEAAKSDCRLKTVDVGFGGVDYALALPKRSMLTSILSRHILRLEESGYLSTLWKRYFGELEKCYLLDNAQTDENTTVKPLTYQNLAGVFYLVLFAMIMGLIVLAFEWVHSSFFDVNKNDYRAPQTIKEALRIRRQRLKQDIVENWWPFTDIRNRFSTIELPSSQRAASIISKQLEKKKPSRRTSQCRHGDKIKELRGYCSETNLTTLNTKRKFTTLCEKARPRQRRFSMTRSLTSFHSKSIKIFPLNVHK